MKIKLVLGKEKSFASLEEALEYCEACTCYLYSIFVENNSIMASGNGCQFEVASIISAE